jgi:hypothetical protein
MYSQDVAPVFSFEQCARTHGLARAREMWAWYGEQQRIADHYANEEEQLLARQAERANHVASDELDGEIEWGMSKRTYMQIYRSSLHERGAVGGELLRDEDYMTWFLKRNEACRRKSRSRHIMEGYTGRIEAAAKYGRQEKALELTRITQIITEASAIGKQKLIA